jgi:hypothetical protein
MQCDVVFCEVKPRLLYIIQNSLGFNSFQENYSSKNQPKPTDTLFCRKAKFIFTLNRKSYIISTAVKGMYFNITI